MRILIVEDEEFIAKILSNILSDAGYQVVCIENGQEAWELLLKDSSFDLLLLDRQLPGLDGLSLLKQVKNHDRLHEIPVVMETGMDDEDSIREGLNSGAYYYLTKPIHNELLLTVVKAALDQSREAREIQTALKEVGESLQFLKSGTFTFRTLNESRKIAQALAKAFPEPQRVALGLHELFLNAVEHGNLAITYDEKSQFILEGRLQEEIENRLQDSRYSDKIVTVSLNRSKENLTVRISDEGNGFDWSQYLEFSPERAFDTHGRGIAMAKNSSFDSITYEGKGNVVTVSVALQ